MTIALIDYGAGNLRSVHNALVAAGAEGVAVTADPDIVAKADRIVLPGVGAFAACMNGLSAIDGLVDAMERRVRGEGVPFLGICVGMQLLADAGEEHGTHQGLGWIGGTVRAFDPAPGLRIPHMGWNRLIPLAESPLLDGLPAGASAYFVHGYAAPVTPDTVAACDHGGLFSAVVQRGLFCGAQFHPERSAATGARILHNFLTHDFTARAAA